jgi:hypothetical protein
VPQWKYGNLRSCVASSNGRGATASRQRLSRPFVFSPPCFFPVKTESAHTPHAECIRRIRCAEPPACWFVDPIHSRLTQGFRECSDGCGGMGFALIPAIAKTSECGQVRGCLQRLFYQGFCCADAAEAGAVAA